MPLVSNLLTGVLVVVGILMTFLIMLQEGKGGGLTALGGTKAAGIEGVTNPIRRATAFMAILFFVLAIALGIINRPTQSANFFEEEKIAEAPTTSSMGPTIAPVAVPVPAPAPTAPVSVPVPVPVPVTALTVSTTTATTPAATTAPATTPAPALKVETKPAEPAKAPEAK